MKEIKFTATMYNTVIIPDEKSRKKYQDFHNDLSKRMNERSPEVEIIIRVRDPRQEWIDLWYSKAQTSECFGEVSFAFVKDGTVCINHIENNNTTVAAPRKGDKYDRKTGIAVAFAKMCGKKIPDYI